MRTRWLIVLLAAVLVAADAGAAAHGVAPSRDAPLSQPQFRTGTELVVVHVTVTDRHGYVTGLTRDAFQILEDRVPQPIRFFGGMDAPVTVGLVVDSSGSMFAGRERIIAAVTSFVEKSNPQDEVFALAFNERVLPVLPDGMPFTRNPQALHAALTRAVVTRGRTALFDALATGLDHVGLGHHDRRALVVVADGGDNASALGFDDVLRRAQTSNAAIYTVGLLDPAERGANPRRLRQLASATGGVAYFPRHIEDVDDALQRIAADLRHSYTLGYVPAATAQDGQFHRLEVVVTSPSRGRVTVRTRAGYIAGLPPTGD